jgi:hypothetical protein
MSNIRLQHALAQLPQYDPPPSLWQEIEDALEAEQLLSEAVQELPVHSPPADVWSNIEAGLERQPRYKRKQLFFSRSAWMAVAAALLLLLVATRWMRQFPSNSTANMAVLPLEGPILNPVLPVPKPPTIAAKKPETTKLRAIKKRPETISFSQKVVDNQLLEVCREPESDAFSLIEQLCQTQIPACDNPEFKILKTELNEVTTARNTLRQALGQYADDPQLLAQMVQLEQTRTAILQQMMQLI